MSDIVYFWYIFGHFTHFTPFYPFFTKCVIFAKNYITIIDIILDHFQPNPQTRFSSKVQKPHFWAILGYFEHIQPNLGTNQIFSRNAIFGECQRTIRSHHFQQKKYTSMTQTGLYANFFFSISRFSRLFSTFCGLFSSFFALIFAHFQGF